MAAGNCVIYALCDPQTQAIRYVGKAKDLAARLRTHRWEAAQQKFQTRKVRWLRTLVSDPAVRVLETVSSDEWAQAERGWIARLRQAGVDLTNYAEGGQTSPVEGKGHTEESKAKMRAAALRNEAKPPSRAGTVGWSKGTKGVMRPNCGSFRLGMEAWNKGKKMSAEYIEANRRGHKGIPWTPARRAAQERRSLSVKGW